MSKICKKNLKGRTMTNCFCFQSFHFYVKSVLGWLWPPRTLWMMIKVMKLCISIMIDLGAITFRVEWFEHNLPLSTLSVYVYPPWAPYTSQNTLASPSLALLAIQRFSATKILQNFWFWFVMFLFLEGCFTSKRSSLIRYLIFPITHLSVFQKRNLFWLDFQASGAIFQVGK